MDGDTLYQLQNLVNRRNVSKNHSSDLSASEDFFLSVAEVHILSACMTTFDMNSVKDRPSERYFSLDSEQSDYMHRRRVLLDAVKIVIDRCVDFSIEDEERNGDNSERDHVYEYAREVLTMGLLYMSSLMPYEREMEAEYFVAGDIFC